MSETGDCGGIHVLPIHVTSDGSVLAGANPTESDPSSPCVPVTYSGVLCVMLGVSLCMLDKKLS